MAQRLDRVKEAVPLGDLPVAIAARLGGIQGAMLRGARDFRDAHTLRVDTMEGLVRFFRDSIGFVITPWCGSADDEARVKQETTATTRVILDRSLPAGSTCAICGRPATSEVVWAKAY